MEKEKKEIRVQQKKAKRKEQIQQEKEKKKNHIMKAAIALFLKNGFEKTSIEEITLKAKVAIGTFYNFFDKKEDVVLYYFYNDIRKCQDEIQNKLNTKESFSEQIEMILSTYWEHIFWNKELSRVFISERIMKWGTEYNTTEISFNKTLTKIIDRAVDGKKIPVEIDSKRVAKIIFALNTMYLISWVNGSIKSKRECLRQIKLDMKCIYDGSLLELR